MKQSKMSKNMEMLYLLFPIIGAFILLFIACCFGKKMKEILHIPKEVVLGRTLPDSHRRALDDSDSSDDDDGPHVTISIRNMTPRFPAPAESITFEEEGLVGDLEEADNGTYINNNEVTFNRNIPRCKSSPCLSKDGYMFVGGRDGCSYIPSHMVQSPARSVSEYLMCPLPVCGSQSQESPSHYVNLTGSVPAQLPHCYESLKQEDGCHGNECSGHSSGSSSTECACNPHRQCLGLVDVHVQMDYIDADKQGRVNITDDTLLRSHSNASDHGNSDLPSMPSSDSGCDMRGQSFDTMDDVTDDKLSTHHQECMQVEELEEDEPG